MNKAFHSIFLITFSGPELQLAETEAGLV